MPDVLQELIFSFLDRGRLRPLHKELRGVLYCRDEFINRTYYYYFFKYFFKNGRGVPGSNILRRGIRLYERVSSVS